MKICEGNLVMQMNDPILKTDTGGNSVFIRWGSDNAYIDFYFLKYNGIEVYSVGVEKDFEGNKFVVLTIQGINKMNSTIIFIYFDESEKKFIKEFLDELEKYTKKVKREDI